MTRTQAQRVCGLAQTLYGDQVMTSIDANHARLLRGTQCGYRAVIVHKKLNRRAYLLHVDN